MTMYGLEPTAGFPVPYALLNRITYPTGASIVYTYGETASILYNSVGSRQIFRVTERKWVSGNTDYKKQTFTYDGNYTGHPNYLFSLPTTFPYSVTMPESSSAYTE